MKVYQFNLSIIIIFLMTACVNHRSDSMTQSKLEGIVDSSGMETGFWQFFDSTGNVLEKGNFQKGVRVGPWYYYKPYMDTLDWISFESPNGVLRSNFPSFIKPVENFDSLIVAANPNSMKAFKIVLGSGGNKFESLQEFKDTAFSELSKKGIKITDSITQFIKTKNGNEYLFYRVHGNLLQYGPFQFFSMVTIRSNSSLVELSLRCNEDLEVIGRRVFFSIAPNFFVNGKRFVEQKDDIGSINGKPW